MLAGKTPLWTYVLAESVATSYPVRDGKITGALLHPFHLGPVGGRIVAETFVGIIANDPNSVINTPSFRPDPRYTTMLGQFGFADLIRAVTQPNSASVGSRVLLPIVHGPRRPRP